MRSASDNSDSDEVDAKTGRDLFVQKVSTKNVFFNNNGYGSEDESEFSDSESEEEDNHEQ